MFRLIECQIGPDANVHDFEFDEESNHLVWRKCSKHFLVDHAKGCVCHKFIFNFGIQDVQHIHDQFCVAYTTIKNDTNMNLFSRNKWNEFILMGGGISRVGILLWFSKNFVFLLA